MPVGWFEACFQKRQGLAHSKTLRVIRNPPKFAAASAVVLYRFSFPYEPQLPPRLDRVSRAVPVLFPLARLQCGAGAANRPGHSGLQPREFSGSAAGRFGVAPPDQLSRAGKFVSVSGHRRAVAFVEFRAGGPRRRRRGGIEGHSRTVAGRRRDHFVSRRHADDAMAGCSRRAPASAWW